MEDDSQKITIVDKTAPKGEKSRISIIVGVYTVTRHVTMECANSLIECSAAAKDRGYGFNCIFYKAATMADAKNALFNTAMRVHAAKPHDNTHLLMVAADVAFTFKDIEKLIAEDQPLICALPPVSKNWQNIASVAKSGKLTVQNIQSVLTGFDFTYVPSKVGLPKSGIIDTPYCELAFALFKLSSLAAFVETRDVKSSIVNLNGVDTYDVFGTRLVTYKDGGKAIAIGDKLFCTMWNTAMGAILINTRCRVGRQLEEYVVGALDQTIVDSTDLADNNAPIEEVNGKEEVDKPKETGKKTRFDDESNKAVVVPSNVVSPNGVSPNVGSPNGGSHNVGSSNNAPGNAKKQPTKKGGQRKRN